MRQRPLGATSLDVTELALGTWGLSGDGYGPVPEAEQERVIERALAMGVRLFDTADCYANGKMEQRLGERLAKHDDARIVTKIGTRRDDSLPLKDFSIPYLKEAFERSRERLGRERIDCLLLHNPSRRAFERAELGDFMQELRSSGKIRCWGASVGDAEIGRAALQAGAQVLQLAYNVFHTKDLVELEALIIEKNVGVLGRSVLSHGILCGLWPHDKQFASFDHRSERWNSDELRSRITQLNAVRTLLSSALPSLRAIALRFALSQERLASVVLGPRSALQLDQLVREAGSEPPYIEARRLSELRERLVTVGVYQ
jgi:aryl-alcohol dehydrogenase-like predicted oxidoreductase